MNATTEHITGPETLSPTGTATAKLSPEKREKYEALGVSEEVIQALAEDEQAFLRDPGELSEEEKIVLDGRQIVVVCGLIGSGKSHVANQLAQRMRGNARVFSSDRTREVLDAGNTVLDLEKYSKDMGEITYQKLYEDALAQASEGTAIVDATFWDLEKRMELETYMQEHAEVPVPITYVYVDADEDVARDRIEQRWAAKAHQGDLQKTLDEEHARIHASEANYSHRLRDQRRWDPFVRPTIRIDNSSNESEALGRQLDQIVSV